MKRLGAWGIGLALLWANTAGAVETVYYIHTDALGSPVAMTDANRHVVERTQYGPYGEVLNRPEHDGPGYTGHEEDAATGLTNMQQRYDDKVTGRFLSVDPVQPNGNTGGSFNRYAYANDNPYRFTDPDGRQDCPKDKGNGGRCSPPPEPTTGCLTQGCSASANTSVIQVASPSKSDEQKMKAQANQSGGNANSKASEQSSGSSSIGHWFRDRASATAEGAAAFGPGVEGQATKRLGSAPDSTAESFVVGEGLYAGATGNFEAFRWGQQTSTGPTGKLVIDPASYVHIKVAGVIAFGVSVDLYPHGGAVTVSVGIGAGEYAIVKPPATISLEQNW